MLHFWNSWIAFGNWTRILKPEDQKMSEYRNVSVKVHILCVSDNVNIPFEIWIPYCQKFCWKCVLLEIENLWQKLFCKLAKQVQWIFYEVMHILCTRPKYISVNRKTQFNFVLKCLQSILSWESWCVSFKPKYPGQRNIGGDNVRAVRRKILVLDLLVFFVFRKFIQSKHQSVFVTMLRREFRWAYMELICNFHPKKGC